MQPPTWPLVPAEIDGWTAKVNRLKARSEAFPEQLAELHAAFERIHPFLDGNGRTGRLVLHLVLARLGYPPAIIYKRQRSRYLTALRRADNVPAIAGPARLVPLAALPTSEVGAAALRTAANRGRLQAVRGPDGEWRSSRNWVSEYVASRYRRDS